MPLAQRHGIDERFEQQAGYCTAMGSPLGGALLRQAAQDFRSGGIVRRLFVDHPVIEQPARAGIRFLAALHSCALDGSARELAAHLPSCGGDGDASAAWVTARDYLSRDLERIAVLCTRTPQTNEPARSTPLLGGLLVAAAKSGLPVRLLEIGASAGLNTRLDHYRYEGNDWSWGDPASPLVLRNRERSGRPASLDALLRIVERAACDLHPLDVTRPEDRNYLRSFVWPDQVERLQRLDDACEAARGTPLDIEKADAISWTHERFRSSNGMLTVLMHSVVMYYLKAQEREALQESVLRTLSSATADAPAAWLRLEDAKKGGETRLTLSSGDDIVIARSDGHGQDIEWSDAA